jgi:DNA helicase MCM8
LQRQSVLASDYQRVKLQELDSYDDDIARVPRTFDVEFRGNLVDCCISGDVIDVVGIVKTFQAAKTFARNTEAGLHQLYILANSVAKSKSSSERNESTVGQKRHRENSRMDSGDVSFSTQDLQDIRSIALTRGCLSLLCASFCPGIFGHELVKTGLLLGLFGGSRPNDEVESADADIGNVHSAAQNGNISIRSDIHVLVVGDPGLGKSQMLRAAAALSPRAIFVCANTATTAGLTVAVCREGSKGDVNIEAGALVLADRGVCCIDELDKMSSDPHSLLEAMEQQQISIAKSGVVTSLKSRCSILAAANPVGKHLDIISTLFI